MTGVVSIFKEKIAYYSDKERDRILKAADWALEIQKGLPSDPAVVCLLDCALILTELEMDADTIIAALLKDTLKADVPADAAPRQPALNTAVPGSSPVSVSAIEEHFGKNAAVLTIGISRIADFRPANKTIQEAENIRKMLFALVSDIRVILIKLAEKLSRMHNLEFLPYPERKAEAQECLDIYAPLAGKLGISWIKDELEDLSLKNLNHEAFQQIRDIVALKKSEREQFLNAIQDRIYKAAAREGLGIEVTTRAKHFYSIYQKMRKRNKAAADLFDLFGIRIICDSIENCYNLLGLIHRLWKPLDGRFKDYIAIAKPNGYQSLHTTVMAFSDAAQSRAEGAQGYLLEIQIRTKEMHHIAENGIASHWLYKKGTSKEIVRPVDISIVNKLKDWKQRESESGEEISADSFLDEIKKELLKDSIYVFTPQGKVIELPMGATPIDFAYAIHSAIGDHCAGAKADGVIIPLSSELQNTQVVEILTAPNAHPHINWLRLVKTAKARNKIRSWLQQNDANLIIGKNIVARKRVREAAETPQQEKEQTPQLVIQSAVQDTDILHVRVEDEKDMMIHFAKCCRPVTGDAIIGYISRGRGIIVHKKNCRNLLSIPDFPERRIETQWENADSVLVKRFQITARSAVNLFSEIEGAIHKQQGHLLEGRLEETSANQLTGYFTIQLDNGKELKQALKNLRGIPAVLSIKSLSMEER
ncbi:MAG: HD domain-containing protein [Treponema sp.]|jgi:GTP pyrophosphokinase|nr:HD domain-containing protein [Treponema sp.]